jgi:FAD/FMN-containing dehydrogenase/SAM-dependent methyltransferase
MHAVTVDPQKRRAIVEGGATWGQLDVATQEFGLAVTGGRIRGTGVAGLTLGSGSGWLERKLGLTCDLLRSVEIVTADGATLTASETENPDLFWAVRGAGGNFGVVTSFEFELHPVGPQVLGGLVMYSPFNATELVRHFRDFMATAPDEVGAGLAFISAPDAPFVPEFARGKPVLGAVLAYFGPIEQGQEVLRPMREFGPPVGDLVRPMSYTDLQGLLEPGNQYGMQNYWKAEFLAELPDEAIDDVVACHQRVPSPFSQVILMPLGGAMARVDENAMAFGQRQAPFNIHILAMWEDPADSDRQIAWAREFHQAIKPYSTGGAYLNFIGNEGNARVRAAFGPEKYARLVELKRRYDPENVFAGNQNIPPHESIAEELPAEPEASRPYETSNRREADGRPAPFAILEMLNGMWAARALHVAANLGIADALAAGPRTADDIAACSGCEPVAMQRLLRALSTVGVFASRDDGTFEQTPLSEVLTTEHPFSVGAVARLFGSDWQWRAWSALEHTIRQGKPAMDHEFGVGLLEFLDNDPAASSLFADAMTELSRLLNRAVMAAYDFSGSGYVADVSGGHGLLLLDVLQAEPELTGILLDRPTVVEQCGRAVREAKLDGRLRVAACDYHTDLPEQVDTILLNRVLQDWDDADAVKILQVCRDGLRPGGRVVVVEHLLTDDKRGAFLDLQMMVLRGGRERSAAELETLFNGAGLELAKTVRTPSPMVVLVAKEHDTP